MAYGTPRIYDTLQMKWGNNNTVNKLNSYLIWEMKRTVETEMAVFYTLL